MNCPVVSAMNELYGGYEYNATNGVNIVVPSGFQGGGVSENVVCIDDVTFYITTRKLQFARAKLNSARSDAELSITDAFDNKYYERMFKDYYGKKSIQIYNSIIDPVAKRLYSAVTRSIDIINIMESICSSEKARDFPSEMSLPTVEIDPEIIDSIPNDPKKFSTQLNQIILYANKVCVGGVRAHIEPLNEPDFTLREFTFQQDSYDELMRLDMEVAEYALKVEKLFVEALKKLSEIANLCQNIIDRKPE